MAEDIVACPGCGKKFRIPEGAPGGTFQCTACNASVPYGKAAAGKGAAPKAGAAKPAAAPASRGPAPAARPGAAAAHAAPHSRHGHAGHHASHGRHAAGRHAHDDDEADEAPHHHGKKEPDKTMVWVSVGGIVVLAVGFFVVMQKNKKPEVHPPLVPAVTTPATPPVAAPPVVPTPTAADPAAGSGAGAGATAGAGAGAGSGAPAASGIGGTGVSAGSGAVAPTNLDALFVRIADVSGVTEQERAAFDKDVALVIDRDTAAAGVAAGRRLSKLGRKAIPSLLSVFESHWKGKKWDDDKEKIAAHEVQTILIQVVKADRPGGDFIARYDPRSPVPPKDFEKAARMWVRWWLEKGKDLEKFADFPE